MRTLLVDNLDSYTFNLFQLIARVQQAEPVVVRHDAVDDAVPHLDAFDNVVISPGPGHPGNERDFGLSTRVLAEAEVPVLGVCLGHQGIGLLGGARVSRAPAARHGHLAAVRHDGLELFSGVPQDFTAVRYHSLCVWEPLPDELTATAWSEDGVLMGLRHRTRPLWGVQFHPESVLTEHGERLMANFRDLTLRHHGVRRTARRHYDLGVVRPPNASWPGRVARPPSPRTSTLPPARPTRPAGGSTPPSGIRRGYRLHTRQLAGEIDAEAAFTRRFSRAEHSFWLDSSRVEPGLSRFSFLGDGTGPLAELVRCDVSARITRVERAGRPATLVAESVFDHLKRELALRRVADPGLPFDFTGGYVGYLGYEAKADSGATNRHRAFLKLGDVTVASFSPERFLKARGWRPSC